MLNGRFRMLGIQIGTLSLLGKPRISGQGLSMPRVEVGYAQRTQLS